MPRATVVVCSTCKQEGKVVGPDLLSAARAAAPSAVEVRSVRCLANCSRGPSALVRAEGGWTYLFGQLDPAKDGPALVAGAELLADSGDGLMPWRGRPEVLKRCMLARVPPIDFPEG